MINKSIIAEMSEDKKVVLDFYADWCEPCQEIKPELEELAAKWADEIEFVFINVDEYPQLFLKKQFGVIAVPNLQMWEGGRKKSFVAGNQAKEVGVTKIKEFVLK